MQNSRDVWTGKASSYNRTRPTPPVALLDLLTQLIEKPHPSLVVDLGSGTGLSTAIWLGRAEQVIGIEPNSDMRQEAQQEIEGQPYATHIEYREGLAEQTGLPDGSADIVTAAQAFHWMEPITTLAEVGRILRPGGLFAAYDYDWPPTIHWELDQIVQDTARRSVALIQERGLMGSMKIWPKDKHLENMRASGQFRYIREVMLHNIEQGDAARFMEMGQTSAFNQQFDFTEQELGLDPVKEAALQYIGVKPIPWYISYRVRIGIK